MEFKFAKQWLNFNSRKLLTPAGVQLAFLELKMNMAAV